MVVEEEEEEVVEEEVVVEEATRSPCRGWGATEGATGVVEVGAT